MTILTALGLIYIGYVIGAVHLSITAQKENGKYKELANEYAKIVSELTVSIQDYIKNNRKEVVDGSDENQ